MLQAGLSTTPMLRGSGGATLARGSSGGAQATPPATPPGLAKQDMALIEGKAAPAGCAMLQLPSAKPLLFSHTAVIAGPECY